MIGLLPHILLSRTFATTPIATLHANHGQRKTWECLRFSTETETVISFMYVVDTYTFVPSNMIMNLQLRMDAFPTSISGKGHDTGVVCRWLEFALENLDPRPQHRSPCQETIGIHDAP